MNLDKLIRYAIGPVGIAVLGFVSLPIITWFYSVEDVGKVSMLQVVSSFCILLFGFGLDQAYVREYHESSNKPALFKMVLIPGLFSVCFILSLIYIIDNGFISKWLYGEDDYYLSLVSILFFLFAFCLRFLSLILRMEERALNYSFSQLFPKIFFLVFILITVWLGYSQNTYNLLTANLLSVMVGLLISGWSTRKEWIVSLTSKINWNKQKELFIFGLPLVIGGLASWGLNVMDKLFLRSLSSFTELGIYSVAISITGVVIIFSGIFNTIWSPMVYKWVSEGNVDIKKIDNISEYVLAAIYFIIVFSGLFSWVIPLFLPKEYYTIQYLITVCLLGPLLYTLSETTAIGITIARKTKLAMIASVSAMLINLLGNYLLVPYWGAAGAAASTAFAFWIFYILRTEFSKRVWVNIDRNRSYFITLFILVVSFIHMLVRNNSYLILTLWLIVMFLGLWIFRNVILMVFRQCYKGSRC
ncbi:lipopolysaccharide biosynthesis protein [Acinetobacter calcoaceticus]|uniref:lipopolysaccharide biosynthesis protein n=1 Tax=Acinetobacter calcoaceticus TaxID=471 RepID=UPI00192A7F87|nr:oligosaccharide flippase family protein [Acinetobacter calcoaceticus]